MESIVGLQGDWLPSSSGGWLRSSLRGRRLTRHFGRPTSTPSRFRSGGCFLLSAAVLPPSCFPPPGFAYQTRDAKFPLRSGAPGDAPSQGGASPRNVAPTDSPLRNSQDAGVSHADPPDMNDLWATDSVVRHLIGESLFTATPHVLFSRCSRLVQNEENISSLLANHTSS